MTSDNTMTEYRAARLKHIRCFAAELDPKYEDQRLLLLEIDRLNERLAVLDQRMTEEQIRADERRKCMDELTLHAKSGASGEDAFAYLAAAAFLRHPPL